MIKKIVTLPQGQREHAQRKGSQSSLIVGKKKREEKKDRAGQREDRRILEKRKKVFTYLGGDEVQEFPAATGKIVLKSAMQS